MELGLLIFSIFLWESSRASSCTISQNGQSRRMLLFPRFRRPPAGSLCSDVFLLVALVDG